MATIKVKTDECTFCVLVPRRQAMVRAMELVTETGGEIVAVID